MPWRLCRAELIRQQAATGLRDYQMLADWGETLRKNPPELLAKPDVDLEKDVEIL